MRAPGAQEVGLNGDEPALLLLLDLQEVVLVLAVRGAGRCGLLPLLPSLEHRVGRDGGEGPGEAIDGRVAEEAREGEADLAVAPAGEEAGDGGETDSAGKKERD